MSVIVGRDFSPPSRRAAELGARLASKLQRPLHLVHAVPAWPREYAVDDRVGLLAAVENALVREAESLKTPGTDVDAHALFGEPEQVLAQSVEKLEGELLLLGERSAGAEQEGLTGRGVENLVRKSAVPTWVLRSPERLGPWLEGKRPLRVGVALDFDEASDEAWRWVMRLTQVGPVEWVGLHVYWPPEQYARLGLAGPRSYLDVDPQVAEALQRELAQRFTPRGGAPSRMRAGPGIGPRSENVLHLAKEEEVDLLVVGMHHRRRLQRLWEGSVSHGVLRDSPISVLCVPAAPHRREVHCRTHRTVLVATDFSPAGNRAVAEAYAQLPNGGTVHLLHVVPKRQEGPPLEPHDLLVEVREGRASWEERLRELIPMDAPKGITTVLHALESQRTAEVIAQAAARLGAEVVCLGTSRVGLKGKLLGSVAQSVLERATVPVLFVQAPPH